MSDGRHVHPPASVRSRRLTAVLVAAAAAIAALPGCGETDEARERIDRARDDVDRARKQVDRAREQGDRARKQAEEKAREAEKRAREAERDAGGDGGGY